MKWEALITDIIFILILSLRYHNINSVLLNKMCSFIPIYFGLEIVICILCLILFKICPSVITERIVVDVTKSSSQPVLDLYTQSVLIIITSLLILNGFLGDVFLLLVCTIICNIYSDNLKNIIKKAKRG